MNNLIDHILPWSEISPDRTAIYLVGQKESLTYIELRAHIGTCASNLVLHGIGKGSRILIATEFSLDLFVLLQAIFSIGASGILVERGFSKAQLSACIRNSRPDAVVGSRKVLWKLLLLPASWRIRRRINVADLMIDSGKSTLPLEPTDESGTTALITFTSGSTGLPKGIIRTHQTLIAQHHALSSVFSAEEGLVHLTSFPVVSLHNLASGFSTLIATLDDTPEKLLEAISHYRVTSLSGAPYFYSNLIHHCRVHGIVLSQITTLVIGGAAVDAKIAEDIVSIFPNAQGRILYGSSEAEPIASITLDEWIQLSRVVKYQGYCVGKAVESAQVRIVATVQGPVRKNQKIDDTSKLAGEIGEIIVSGDHVTESYFNNPEADGEFKIHDDHGRIWHRTGDLGFFDDEARIWLVGRTSNPIVHKECVLYPLQVESIVNRVPGVTRSALVSMKNGKPVLWVIPDSKGALPDASVRLALRNHDILIDEIIITATLPFDARHRSKIDYPKLKTWTSVRYGK